ncbi:MAG: hypothetical protein OXD50_10200 [Chloroflexi bacterium]|nr:hypothetical protein [Chloroflexota bacterium]
MSLKSRLSRVRTALKQRLRTDPIEIELDVVEQLIVQHLLLVEQASFAELSDAVLAARPTADQQQVRLSLIRFESFRLVQRILHPELEPGKQMSFTLTADGRRLKRVIPDQPRSRIQTWL